MSPAVLLHQTMSGSMSGSVRPAMVCGVVMGAAGVPVTLKGAISTGSITLGSVEYLHQAGFVVAKMRS